MAGVRNWRFWLIVLVATAVAVGLHQLSHDPLSTLTVKPKSVVLTSGYFPPVAIASLFVAFGIVGLTFLAIRATLHGTKLQKGALFGIALGGMYLVGMIEAWVVYPVPLSGEVYTGAVDGAGILLMSLLTAAYVTGGAPDSGGPARPLFPAQLAIPVLYVLARYFSYAVLHIESTHATRPLATLVWTAAMGCWCAVMYTLVGRGMGRLGPVRQAAVFGGLVFGLNWLIFNLFALLFIAVPVTDLAGRAIVDALAVALAVYVSSFFETPGGATVKSA